MFLNPHSQFTSKKSNHPCWHKNSKVLIQYPPYVAGKVGTVCDREVLCDGKPSDRWLIQVDSEDILVSLTPQEFELLRENT